MVSISRNMLEIGLGFFCTNSNTKKTVISIFDKHCNSYTRNNKLDGQEITNFAKELIATGYNWVKSLLSKLGISTTNSNTKPKKTTTTAKTTQPAPLQYNNTKLNNYINQNLKSNLAIVKQNSKLFKFKYGAENLARCDKKIVNTAIDLGKIAQKYEYTLYVSDGYRSRESQAASYNSGKKGVAAPGTSAHEAGLALDIWLITPDGKKISIEQVTSDKLKNEMLGYFRSNGIEWGGNWKDPHEPWHINVQNWRKQAQQYC